MIKNIIFSIIAAIVFIIGAVFLIKKSTSSSEMFRNFYLVKGYKTKYPFQIAVIKGTTYNQAMKQLNPHEQIIKIYYKEGKKWVEANKKEIILHDVIIKN